MDTSLDKLDPTSSPFLMGTTFDINGNPGADIGTANPTGEGQNQYAITTLRSNEEVPSVPTLPEGYNKNILSFESVTTQELYYYNFNGNGNHGIYVLNGNTGIWSKVIVDPELAFSDESQHAIADHRCRLRYTKDKDGNILEKYLLLVDGKNWQKYINVRAAIATDGFNASLFPYWTLQPPHFDRRELFEYAVRPPMYKPIAAPIPNTVTDSGTQNRVIDQSFQFAIAFQNTDGRSTTLSPYSLPYNTISESFLNDPENIPKKGKLTLPAGSPMTEKILIYVRSCGGTWYLYDTINKFTSCEANDPAVIGNEFWKRIGQWTDYSYNQNLNTIEFIFDNSKVFQIIDPKTANRLQNDIPQVSVAMTDLEDQIALVNNRYGYNNFGCSITDKLDAVVVEKPSVNCPVPIRRVRMYVYIGRERGNLSSSSPNNSAQRNVWISQVGYYLGEDTQMRFGGICYDSGDFEIDDAESKLFSLDFADKDSFRVYLKGTPYFADGKWFQVNQDLSLIEVDGLLNRNDTTDVSFMDNIYRQRGFFVGVFDLEVPAGKYIATLGRHNVSSTGDYRGQSTYILGIANSRIVSTSVIGPNEPVFISVIKPNAIVSNSKEIEIDCTSADVDLWGNGADLFYVCCPFQGAYNGRNRWEFVEGYLKEERDNPAPIELFPYILSPNMIGTGGNRTDKNGFFWAYTWGLDDSHMSADVLFTAKVNCAYPFNFTVPNTSEGNSGWKPNTAAFLSDFNSGEVGDCNRILYRGTISNLDGTLHYSNIAVSIVDGSTVYSRSDGTFELVVHNGLNTQRISNVYVNAGGSFLITLANCGGISIFNFNENNISCSDCNERVYPFPLNINIQVQGMRDTSLKENGRYSISVHGADLAGRLTFENPFKDISVPSFLERNNLAATYFRVLVTSALNMTQENPDIKWLLFSVTKNVSVLKYVEWVGDEINYIDSNGNIVTDPASAVFVSIRINSLFNYNVSNNFSTLAKYQFVTGDRLRILDDGNGNLLNTSTYGDPIDIQVLGTNYNQAAINAGLQVPQENTILNPTAEQQNENLSISLIVKYDSRLNNLIAKTGFWIEIYTPTKSSDIVPFCEVSSYPVINGEIAIFTGYESGQRKYTYPTSIDLDFWDTYFIQRNIAIPDIGSKYFGHPFQSPNVTDSWGSNCSSCGRQWVKNDNARQQWFGGDVIKSDPFIAEGVLNGLGTFRSENRKDYGTYPSGAIISAHTKRNIVAFIGENDWYTVSWNAPYSMVDPKTGFLKTNPGGLSEPNQKTGDLFGISPEHTGTVIIDDRNFFWFDSKNTGVIKCDYQNATDITQEDEERGEKGGVQSYINAKTFFIQRWNYSHETKDKFDVIAGIDAERGNIYFTFRPRRNNSNNLSSYASFRRNVDVRHQETIVYSTQFKSWLGFVPFAPEGYGRLRGNWANVEMITFAAGKPYLNNNSSNSSFLNFFGQQTQPSIICIIHGDKEDKQMVKILQTIFYDCNPNGWNIDMVYTDFINSFSWMSINQFINKEGIFYGAALRNANSYPSNKPEDLFRSMLQDGYAMKGTYIVFRMVGNALTNNQYNELRAVTGSYILSPTNKA